MKIHTVKSGESVSDISVKYGVREEYLKEINELSGDSLAIGEELLILTPTREYKIKRGDSIEMLSLRFGVSAGDLYSQNPSLTYEEARIGDTLSLRCSEKAHGGAAANGTVYRGYSEKRLLRALPFMTYMTLAAAFADKGGIRKLFAPDAALSLAEEAGKIPLLRIYDKYPERYREKASREQYREDIIKEAKKGGFGGLVINTPSGKGYGEAFSEFLSDLRKAMIGEGLIVITETCGELPNDHSALCDGCIFSYEKAGEYPSLSFEDGEKKALRSFALTGECEKTFVELPVFAYSDGRAIPLTDALSLFRRDGVEITQDEESLITKCEMKRGSNLYFPSLKNVKAILDLIYEYGFMGISFDVMKTPLKFLMSYGALFKTLYAPSRAETLPCNPD